MQVESTAIHDCETHANTDTVSLSIDGAINLFVMANGTSIHALTFTLEPIDAEGTILIYGMNLTGNVSDLSIGFLNISYSTIGYPDVG